VCLFYYWQSLALYGKIIADSVFSAKRVNWEGDGKGVYGSHSDYADEVSQIESFLMEM